MVLIDAGGEKHRPFYERVRDRPSGVQSAALFDRLGLGRKTKAQ